jgi:hypothetical protein
MDRGDDWPDSKGATITDIRNIAEHIEGCVRDLCTAAETSSQREDEIVSELKEIKRALFGVIGAVCFIALVVFLKL